MNATVRTSKFTMNISPEERAMLGELASRNGLTSSDWLRQQIRRAHATLTKPSARKGK